ncbi:MAG TPA: BMP family protein [Bacillota bacterium]|jgi:basic membrane protein A
MKRVLALSLVLVLALTALLAGCSTKPKEEPKPAKKAAMILSGPVNDGGWNQNAYDGLTALKEKNGFEIAVSENVAQADQVNLLRNYANQSFKYIIANGFEYGDAIKTVAAEFPKVTFIQLGGIEHNGANSNAMLFTSGEAGYAVGVLAGLMTKSNKIGFVGAMDIPSIRADEDNAKVAIKAVNPKATVVDAYVGSWTDIAKGKEAALAQIARGVDVIIANGDAVNHGVAEAVKGTKTTMVGWSRDQAALAPDNILTSVVQSGAPILLDLVGKGEAGQLKGDLYVMGMAEGAQILAPFSKLVPQDVQDKVKKVVQDLKDKKITLIPQK